MAFSKKTIQEIAKLIRVKEADLKKVLAAEGEEDLEIPDGLEVFDKDEVEMLKKNEYNSGKEKGVEMAVKEVKTKKGLEFQGKSLEALVKAVEDKTLEEAKVEPDQKVKELEKTVQKLQQTVQEQEKSLADKDKEMEVGSLAREVAKWIPKGVDLDEDEVMALMRAKGMEIRRKDGKIQVENKGEVMVDKLGNPRKGDEVLVEFLKSKNMVPEEGGEGKQQKSGRGGKDEKKVGFTKLSELKAHYKDQGKSVNGSEFMQEAQKLKEENPEFDLNG